MEYFNNWFEFFINNPFGTQAEFYELYYGLPQPIYYALTIGSIVISSLTAVYIGKKFYDTI